MDLERGMVETTDSEPRRFRRRHLVLGVVAFVALVAFVQQEPPHYRDPAFLSKVDQNYRKIKNDHAIAMYDRTVEELSRLSAPFPIQDDDMIVVDDAIYSFEPEDEDVDLSFWSGRPAPPVPVGRRWFR